MHPDATGRNRGHSVQFQDICADIVEACLLRSLITWEKYVKLGLLDT